MLLNRYNARLMGSGNAAGTLIFRGGMQVSARAQGSFRDIKSEILKETIHRESCSHYGKILTQSSI